MPEDRASPTDLEVAHRRFSTDCFNRAWELIEKPTRTPAEEEEMLRLTMVSHWHWRQRTDFRPKNESIACWQVSRIFTLLGQPQIARRFGERCLEALATREADPFLVGYGHEAIARAAAAAGDSVTARDHVEEARRLAEQIDDAAAKKMLLSDLEGISGG